MIAKKNLFSIPWACHLRILTWSPLVDVRYAAHVFVEEATRERTIPT